MTRNVLIHSALVLFVTVAAIAEDAPKQHRFSNQILAYEREDQKLPPVPGSVLMVGSSSFRMWRTAGEDLAPYPVINRGFGGSTNNDALYFFDRIVTPYQPRVILYYEGDNDLAGKTTKAQSAVDGFKEFASRVRKALPETRIVFISIKPSGSRWHRWEEMKKANTAIREFCESDEKLYYVDISDTLIGSDGKIDDTKFIKDRLHMKRESYLLWAEKILPTLEKAWLAAGGPPLTLSRDLKADEQIVFIGDSLTSQNVPNGGYVFQTIERIRKARPDAPMHFERAGIPMATTVDWDSDVLDNQALRHKPTLSIVCLGTADMIGFFGERDGGTPQAQFKAHLTNIVKRLKAAGSDVVLMTPAILGEKVDPDRKGIRYMKVYAGLVRDVAAEQNVPLVDLHRATTDYLRKHKKDDSKDGLLTRDGIHFNEAGIELVTDQLMNCLALDTAEADAQ